MKSYGIIFFTPRIEMGVPYWLKSAENLDSKIRLTSRVDLAVRSFLRMKVDISGTLRAKGLIFQ